MRRRSGSCTPGASAPLAFLAGLVLLLVISVGLHPGGGGAADVASAPQLRPPAGEVGDGSETGFWRRPWSAVPDGSAPWSAAERADRTTGGPTAWAAERGQDDAQTGDTVPVGAGGGTGAGGEAMDPGPEEGAGASLRTVEGFDVAAGSAQAGEGPTVRYTVELEPEVGADLLAVTAAVEEALTDPRSWVVDHRLERVEDPGMADVRVVLATPDTVDELCGQVGLRTEGRYSCWNGTFAALNAMRWRTGAAGFDDLTTYRRYLINHEFGHGLGHGHVDCPAPGAAAPVMMQQTISMGACEANGWPYPDAEDP